MSNVERVSQYLKEVGTYYLLTTDGDQPKGRPFGFQKIIDGKLYIGTGTFKNCYKQILANPKVELLAIKEGEFMRIDCELIPEENKELAKETVAKLPFLQKIYNEETGREFALFYAQNGKVEIRGMLDQKEAFEF
jgi:uncharacterized pyridoxamine 5'-phosphate oxidase family protein